MSVRLQQKCLHSYTLKIKSIHWKLMHHLNDVTVTVSSNWLESRPFSTIKIRCTYKRTLKYKFELGWKQGSQYRLKRNLSSNLKHNKVGCRRVFYTLRQYPQTPYLIIDGQPAVTCNTRNKTFCISDEDWLGRNASKGFVCKRASVNLWNVCFHIVYLLEILQGNQVHENVGRLPYRFKY